MTRSRHTRKQLCYVSIAHMKVHVFLVLKIYVKLSILPALAKPAVKRERKTNNVKSWNGICLVKLKLEELCNVGDGINSQNKNNQKLYSTSFEDYLSCKDTLMQLYHLERPYLSRRKIMRKKFHMRTPCMHKDLLIYFSIYVHIFLYCISNIFKNNSIIFFFKCLMCQRYQL